jgi:hypothetical protein
MLSTSAESLRLDLMAFIKIANVYNKPRTYIRVNIVQEAMILYLK